MLLALSILNLHKAPALNGEWTRGYIAPERMENSEQRVARATDVYWVGIIFYVILYGE